MSGGPGVFMAGVYIFSPCHIYRDGRLERSPPKNLKGDLVQCITFSLAKLVR